MSGLYLIAVVGLLGYLAWRLGGLAVRRIQNRWLAKVCQLVLALLLMTLLVADEIVGGYRFEKLCKEKAVITVDASATQGRTVWFGESQRTQIKLGLIQVVEAKRIFVDATTQAPIYHYYRLEAKGGWFISLLGISEGGSPLLFDALCQPKNLETIDHQLGLIHINRPTSESIK